MRDPIEELCPTVSRVDIAWVCVATNDGNPLHLDHEFAKVAGFADVVVPGHLLIGWIGQYLEDWCGGPENILGWALRFTAPVWPGDRIKLQGELTESVLQSGETVMVTVTATSQKDQVVGIARAEFRPSDAKSFNN
ncbi:MaoC family dehydratase [Cupriavidus basilensis]